MMADKNNLNNQILSGSSDDNRIENALLKVRDRDAVGERQNSVTTVADVRVRQPRGVSDKTIPRKSESRLKPSIDDQHHKISKAPSTLEV